MNSEVDLLWVMYGAACGVFGYAAVCVLWVTLGERSARRRIAQRQRRIGRHEAARTSGPHPALSADTRAHGRFGGPRIVIEKDPAA